MHNFSSYRIVLPTSSNYLQTGYIEVNITLWIRKPKIRFLGDVCKTAVLQKRNASINKRDRNARKMFMETHKNSVRKRMHLSTFLANVNSRSRSLYAIARPSVCRLSVVCNARAPYSGGWNFRQYFYGIRYLGHPLTSTKNFTEIVPGEPLRRGSWTQEG